MGPEPENFTSTQLQLANYAKDRGVEVEHTEAAYGTHMDQLLFFGILMCNYEYLSGLVNHFFDAGEDKKAIRYMLSKACIGKMYSLADPDTPRFLEHLICRNDINIHMRNRFRQSVLHLLFDDEGDALNRPTDWYVMARSLVGKLLNVGVNPNGLDCEGWTPSHYIRSERSWQIWLDALREAGHRVSGDIEDIHVTFNELGTFVTTQCCCDKNNKRGTCIGFDSIVETTGFEKHCRQHPYLALRQNSEDDEDISFFISGALDGARFDDNGHTHISEQEFEEILASRSRPGVTYPQISQRNLHEPGTSSPEEVDSEFDEAPPPAMGRMSFLFELIKYKVSS